MTRTPLLLNLTVALAAPAYADPVATISAEYHSHEEYYCVTQGTLTYSGDAPLREINGFFEIFIDGQQVGHSRDTSYLDIQPGDALTAVFRAPNVPCDSADTYTFVVSACMEGTSFIDKEDCAARISGAGAVTAIRAR